MLKALLLSLLLFAAQANAEQCQVLRIGGVSGWLPITYINPETHDHQGVALDLIKHISNALNVAIDIDLSMPWKRILAYLESGDLDMVLGIYRIDEREALFRFTDSYFQNQARVFVLKSRTFTFNSFTDLQHRIGAIPAGGSFGDEFDNFSKKNSLPLQYLDGKDKMAEMLLAGRIDYFIQDHVDGVMYLRSENLQNKIVALPNPVSSEGVHFALSRQSACQVLLPQINQIIQKAKDDGSLDKIVQRYLN